MQEAPTRGVTAMVVSMVVKHPRSSRGVANTGGGGGFENGGGGGGAGGGGADILMGN